MLIRQVQPADAALLADGFTRLNGASRPMRFLRPKDELSAAGLRYFTNAGHHDHEAPRALDDAHRRGAGTARYVRHPSDPQAAEITVTIAGDWQHREPGTELLALLANRAPAAGIRRFTALVSAGNAPAEGLLRNMSANLTRRELSTRRHEITPAPSTQRGHGQPSQFPR